MLAGSFTKTVCPGVRVGYLVGPAATIAAVTKVALNTYISPNMLSEATVHQFCVSGDIDRSIGFYTEHLGFRPGERAGSAFASVSKTKVPTETR